MTIRRYSPSGWLRVTVATLTAFALLSGCSHRSSGSAGPASDVTSAAATGPISPPPSPGATTKEARTTLAHATSRTASLHSYAFESNETFLLAGQSRTAQLAGRAILPDLIAYRLDSGTNHTEVIKLRGASYHRQAGQPWRKSATIGSGSPIDSLLAILRTLTPDGTAPAGNTVSGTLTQDHARAAGLFGGDVTAPVTAVRLDLDAAGHVTRIRVSIKGTRAASAISIAEDISYTSFDQATPIVAPV